MHDNWWDITKASVKPPHVTNDGSFFALLQETPVCRILVWMEGCVWATQSISSPATVSRRGQDWPATRVSFSSSWHFVFKYMKSVKAFLNMTLSYLVRCGWVWARPLPRWVHVCEHTRLLQLRVSTWLWPGRRTHLHQRWNNNGCCLTYINTKFIVIL